MRLADALAHRSFWKRTRPFPHVVARGVFRPEVARALEDAVHERLARGLSPDPDDLDRFARRVPGYGAYVLHLEPETAGPLALFLSRAWHDVLAGLCGVEATGDVEAALHHHPRGSPTGWIHNDLNPGWFVDRRRPDGINVGDPRACNYQRGTTAPGAGPARETVRAVAMLYYLGNEPWAPGDGGETGLYASALGCVERPLAVVPPESGSLVAFECTPRSYHAFLQNRRADRNCVAMWLHRRRAEVVERWGEESIERWPGS